jgi:pectate lyase
MYAESSTAYVILVQGTISNGADGGQINVRANKSIVGVGSTAFLNGIGINISSQNNIIIQNLRISLTGVTTRTDKAGVYSSTGDEGRPQILVNGGDAIGIQGTSKNIWIDHCELFAENPDTQTNIDLYDGLIDIKHQTGFITVSRNHFHDQHKGSLVGASDDDVSADRKITYHHNYFNKVKLRVPAYRGAVGHFFNNYVVGAQDASEIRAGTCIRIEKNYYESLHYSIYTSSDSEGSAQRIDNVEVMRTERAYPPSCTADIPYTYSDVLTNTTNDVKTLVPAGAGVGKI